MMNLYKCKVGDTVTSRNGIVSEVTDFDICNTSGYDVFINGVSYRRDGSYYNDRELSSMDIVQHTPMGGRVMVDLYNCKVGDTVTRRDGTEVKVKTLDICNTSLNVDVILGSGYPCDVFINGVRYQQDGSFRKDRELSSMDILQHTPMVSRAVEVSEDVDVKPDGSYWDIRAPFVHYTPPIEVSKDAGVKHDDTKTDLSLLTFSMLEPAARAFMHGEGKYGRGNFRNGFVNTRLLAAAMRHLMQFNSGEDNDSESGISHLGHALAAIMMLLDNQKEGKSTEGRYK